MAQQGPPPGRSSGLPGSGRRGRHGAPEPEADPGRESGEDLPQYPPDQTEQFQQPSGPPSQRPWPQQPERQQDWEQQSPAQDSPQQPSATSGGRRARHGAPSEPPADFPPATEFPSQPDYPSQAGFEPEAASPGRADSGPEAGHPFDADFQPAGRPRTAGRPAREARPERSSRPDRGSRPGRGLRSDRDARQHDDPFAAAAAAGEDVPAWAGLSIYPTRPGGDQVRPPAPETAAPGPDGDPERPRGRKRGRAAAARLRRSRRRLYVYCGTAIVAAVIIAVVVAVIARPKPAPHSNFVQTLQAGEFATVPSACGTVSSTLLTQYLSGTPQRVTPASTGAGTSQCTFTVDKRPVFKVLEVTLQAYQPSAVAAGNGSATANALGSFALTQQDLAHPGKKAPLPPATITPVNGLGTQALSALQVLKAHRNVTDLVTVLVRDRNVVVTVTLQAQASGGGYGPVSTPNLSQGAVTIAHAVLAKAEAQKAVSG